MKEETIYNDLDKSIVEFYIERDLRRKYNAKLIELQDSNKNKRSTLYYYKIAASFTFLFLASFLVYQHLNSVDYLAKQYLASSTVIGNQDITRKDVSLIEKIKLEANLAFISRDYEKSIERYELLIANSQAEPIDKFYLGVSYLRANKPNAQKALVLFTSIMDHKPIQQEVEWFTSLTYIALKDYKSGKTLLEKIVSNKQYKYQDAMRLLDKL